MINNLIQNSKFKIQNYVILILFACLLSSCVKYSLSGGDTGSAKTVTIKNFLNEAASPPYLSQTFNEKLRDYYQQNTKLEAVGDNGDWIIQGRIIAYTVTPVAPSGTGTAKLNRLTITVNVDFTNNMEGPNEIKSFTSDFSFYADFSQQQTLNSVERGLIDTILDKIVFDIFSRTTSNW